MAVFPLPDKPVLALYDCRSKQAYIYRTNRMQEISGGSLLLAGVFKNFFAANNHDFKFKADWDTAPTLDPARNNFLKEFQESGYDAEIVYEGGGNLCLIFRNFETYTAVNRKLSRQILESTFTVGVISACTEVTGNFSEDRRRLYLENARRKNLGFNAIPCNALPFTLVDRTTFQPVVKQENGRTYTTESLKKRARYQEALRTNQTGEQNLDAMTDHGEKSILAVIYIDGNNMGLKVKNVTTGADGEPISDYTEGVKRLRAFSIQTNQDFVERPLAEITRVLDEERRNADRWNQHIYKFRKVIGGGDEITLVCNGRAVPLILDTYFNTLKQSGGNSACAGVVLFHSHMPFSDVYKIAEQCCDSGKEQSHKEGNGGNNYIDFHFIHAGITNDLGIIRETQEGGGKRSSKPYEFQTTWKNFKKLGELLTHANRSDIKALYEGMVAGDSYYAEALRQIHSRRKLRDIQETDTEMKKMIFDITPVFDLWFGK